MKSLLFLFVFFVASQVVSASNNREVIIAVDLFDCVNCSVNLSTIHQQINNNNITLIFQEKYRIDSIFVKEKYGLKNYSSFILFSDSLYNHYTVNSVGSTISVLNNGKIVYQNLLLKSKIDDLVSLVNSDLTMEINIKEKTLKKDTVSRLECLGNYTSYYYDSDTTFITNKKEFGLYFFVSKDKSISYFFDSLLLVKTFEQYYSKEWMDKYKRFLTYQLRYSALKPSFKSVVKLSDTTLGFLGNIKLLEPEDDNNLDDMSVLDAYFLYKYSIDGKFIEMYFIDNLEMNEKQYYLNSRFFYVLDGDYYFPIVADSLTVKSKVIAKYKLNDNNILKLDEILPFTIPSTYIQYEIGNNLQEIKFNNKLFLFHFGNLVYDIEKRESYQIPLSEHEFSTIAGIIPNMMQRKKYNFLRIYDVCEVDDDLLLLYKNVAGDLNVLRFGKNNGKIVDNFYVFRNWITIGNKGYPEFHNSNTIRYVDENSCVKYIDFLEKAKK